MKAAFFMGILLVSTNSFSQLDSVNFSMSFVINPTFTIGLDEVAQQGNIFQVRVYLNDVNDVGSLMVMVYDSSTEIPVAIIKLDREKILSGIYTENERVVFNFPYIDPFGTYKVILETQNFQQAYLPRVEKNFPIN